jgi:cation transport ATPase
VIQTVARVTQVAFDKTGTLTAGHPMVTDLILLSGSETDLLAVAGGVEAGSSHPLAQAILTHVTAAGIPPCPPHRPRRCPFRARRRWWRVKPPGSAPPALLPVKARWISPA